jgi:4-amino-4-deoxy-L-arabinose transferase-like glycosyltransferase
LSPLENQPGPPYYYIPVIIAGFFPFVAFLPQAIARAWRSASIDGRFLISSVIVPFIFFSVAQTKLPNYIALAFPAMAVLAGETLGAAVADKPPAMLRRSLLSLVVALLVVVAGILVYGRLHFTEQLRTLTPALAVMGSLVVLLALGTFAGAILLRRPWIVPWGLAAMMSAFILVVVLSILPIVEATSKPMKAMAAAVMTQWRPGERICFDGVRQGFSLDYYTNGPPVTSVGDNVDDVPPAKYFRLPQAAVCVVSPDAYRSLSAGGYRLKILQRTPTLWLVST